MLPAINRIKEKSRGKAKLPGSRQKEDHRRGNRNKNSKAITDQGAAKMRTVLTQNLGSPEKEHWRHHDGNLCVAERQRCGSESEPHDLSWRTLFSNGYDPTQDQRREDKAESYSPVFVVAYRHMDRGKKDVYKRDP
jgi:hypothetical protein